MSETDHSETSESTIEPFQFDKILENLEHGALDALESKDFLSYSTLLDIYLNDPTKYSNTEKEELLGHLLTILSDNEELTFEIGWDIPQLVILYVDSDYDFHGPLRKSPGVYKVLKIFETLALHGNPKELFLKSCELLSSLDMTDGDMDSSQRENFFDIKLYCVFELVDSCLKKIKTLYPSRFLLMAVTSFLNLVYRQAVQKHSTLSNAHFMMKRAYSFERNYISPPLPDKIDCTKEELEKIIKDEEYLQRKLLTGFLTNVIYLVNTNGTEGYAMDHFSWLQKQSKSKTIFDFEIDVDLSDRFVELAYSFDIELLKTFQTFITDAHKLLIPLDTTKSDDEVTEIIFEKLIIDYQKNLFSSIINSDLKNIKDSIIGELILYTHSISAKKEFSKPTMTINDALVLTLRLIIPQMVNAKFLNEGVQDVVTFWIWFSLYQQQKINQQNLSLDISKIPKILFTIFLQCILFMVIQSQQKPNFRFMVLTLLTKILILSPNVGYGFIKDSLTNCPYESVKSPLIGVYKELLLKDKADVDSIDLDKLKLSSDETTTAAVAPPLPPREETPSYALNTDKLNDLVSLIKNAESAAFVDGHIDPTKLSTLAAYLNLLVGIKRLSIVVKNKELITPILSSVETKIKEIKSTSKNPYEVNAGDMLQLTIDRFNE
ncbi:YBP1 CAP1-binding-protein [Candida maltosa Xu316]|uniref:CAP1-binding-protein n=1 Tax=Candida maltosa (strain Xu316) TaxID=1245528 RepID=M3K3U7_CANMX|nr:hypothetical protein G210_5056 [Candida maltosa Xu316]